jgi:hypothetical protein
MEPNSPARSSATAAPEKAHPQSLMQLTISAGCMSALQKMLRRGFGGQVLPTRVQALDQARKVKLSLLMEAALAPRLIGALVRSLPGAEIGRITHV